MKNLHFLRAIITAMLLSFACLAAAEPSIDQIYQAAKSGNMAQAETMIGDVLAAHPDSAKAHFVHAELLAHQNRIGEARAEFLRAQKLQPNLAFAKPDVVNKLKNKLYAGGVGSYPEHSSNGGGSLLLWGGIILGIFAIIMVVRMLNRRPQQNNLNPAGYNNPPVNPGYGPGYPNQPGGMGSGLMGNLATGAAIGAGVVAGEVLMHKILDDDHPNRQQDYAPNKEPAPVPDDFGGEDFGIADNSSWDNSGDSSWTDSSSFDNDSDWS